MMGASTCLTLNVCASSKFVFYRGDITHLMKASSTQF
ncbi:hypothetical protein AB205_0073250 [Aquarana catesbeiana]|uniref:Uncharacterized protein n=1 Tax=Aquarana catesbeiana TaxID=8400 RepID=A0A2G9Q1L7_AQUCT|nr:hypothetical protein AB205_0073250 [Aquarana catesbeiana]